MSLRDCLRPPERPYDPYHIYEALEAYALRHGIEVVQANLRDPASAMFVEETVLGTIGAHGGHHVVFVDEHQTPEEKALTLAHELSHIQLEYGSTPPRLGIILDVHGQVEPRAYGTEYLFAVATGLLEPPHGVDPASEVMEAVGIEPVVQACTLVQAVRDYERSGYRLTGYEEI
jgi:hypothetical protein